MRREIQLVVITLLLIGIVMEGLIYKSVQSEVDRVTTVFKESKDDYDSKINKKEVEGNQAKVFGYSDILDLLSKNLNVRITKFEKNATMSDKIIVKIEASMEEQDFNSVVATICDMESFSSIRKLNIKAVDRTRIDIIIDAEYRIN